MSKNCPNAGEDKPRPPRACFKCKEEGHMAKNCPNAGEEGDKPKGKRVCYKCNQEGHLAKDCTNECVDLTQELPKARYINNNLKCEK